MNDEKIIIKKDSMIPNDICFSCNNFENCSYVKNKKAPSYFCEEFYNYIYKKENKKEIISSYDADNYKNKENKQFKGLCINCENRERCVNSRTDSGIWHCEEYL
jgi:hypothetical protein